MFTAAVKRRTRRNSWAYMLWLLAWLPPMVWMAGNLSFHVPPFRLLPLLIPLVVVLAQLAYPTLLGWAAIIVPSTFATGVMLFFVVVTGPGRVHDNLPALVISSVAAGFYVLVCVALWFARPELADAVATAPTTFPNAGSSRTPPASVI